MLIFRFSKAKNVRTQNENDFVQVSKTSTTSATARCRTVVRSLTSGRRRSQPDGGRGAARVGGAVRVQEAGHRGGVQGVAGGPRARRARARPGRRARPAGRPGAAAVARLPRHRAEGLQPTALYSTFN